MRKSAKMTPFLLDTTIFNKLIRKRDFFQQFTESTKSCNFPDHNSLYITPFSVLEYLGLKIEHPIILPKKFPEHQVNEEIEKIISNAYQFYNKQELLSPKAIKLRLDDIETYVINEGKIYFDRLKDYIHSDFSISSLSYHLTADFIHNFPFPIERRRDAFVRLSMDILRNIYVPYEVSKFRLVQNDWDSQWARLKKESSGSLSRFDKSIRMKSKGDFLDSDIVHLTTLGIYTSEKTYPLVAVTSDNPEDIIGRISLYKGLIRFLKYFIKTQNGLENFPILENTEGIIFYANNEGKFIGKSTVSEIPTFGKDYNS